MMKVKEILYNNLPNSSKEWVIFILIILVVITLGLVVFNNYLAIQYKATLINNPCALCTDCYKPTDTSYKHLINNWDNISIILE